MCFYLRNSGETITSFAESSGPPLPVRGLPEEASFGDGQGINLLPNIRGTIAANCQARSHLELAEPSQIPQAEADKAVVPRMGLFRSEGQKLEVLSDTTWYVKFTSSIDRYNFLFIHSQFLNFHLVYKCKSTHTLCMLRTFR